jgi:hypothetical protein
MKAAYFSKLCRHIRLYPTFNGCTVAPTPIVLTLDRAIDFVTGPYSESVEFSPQIYTLLL